MNFAYRHRNNNSKFIHKGSAPMNEKVFIVIPSTPELTAIFLERFANDWSEVLNFLINVADEQGVYFDSGAVASKMISKYAEPA